MMVFGNIQAHLELSDIFKMHEVVIKCEQHKSKAMLYGVKSLLMSVTGVTCM